jgi:nucleotide-binding universal stress UspA family protein
MLRLQAIVHPTDFSNCSDYAFQLACSLAQDHGARLIVLHVTQPVIVGGEMSAYYVQTPAERQRLEAELLHRRAPPDIQLEHRLEEGNPAELIVTVAEETGCDLIVMGTHGRTGFSRLLMGSVAEMVMRRAPCPVLTVRDRVAEKLPERLHRELVQS